MLTLIDQIAFQGNSLILEWASRQRCTTELWNGKPTKRLEKWFGKGVHLLNYGKAWETYDTSPIAQEPLLEMLCQTYYPEANSVLLYKYNVGSGISAHEDKAVFAPKVILINLIDVQPDLFGNKPKTKFKYLDRIYLLGDGDVIEFNARVCHSVPLVTVPRYSISLRVVT